MWLKQSCQLQAAKSPVFSVILILSLSKLPRCYSHLSRRSVPGTHSLSSRTRSGSSPPCRCRCAGRGWTGTVWAALWSTKASPPLPSGPQPVAGCLCSARPQTGLWCSPRNRSSTEPSTPEEEATTVESFHKKEFKNILYVWWFNSG